MVDPQDTWVSTISWIRSDNGTTGSRQKTMLRTGAGSATPVQPVTAPEPGIRAPFERLAIDASGPLPRRNQGHWYLLITMGYFTKWPKAYAIPNQEVSTVAEVLVTNFYNCGLPLELHCDQGRNFESHLIQRFCNAWEWGIHAPTHYAPAHAVGKHGGTLHQNGQGAPTEGRGITPDGLRCKITHLPPGLQGIHSQHYGLDPS
jgi:hypothetical protein